MLCKPNYLKVKTLFLREILFSLKGIKRGKDFDINDNTYPLEELRDNNIFLEGVASFLGIDSDDNDSIVNEVDTTEINFQKYKAKNHIFITK